MRHDQYSPTNYESVNHKDKEVLLSELENIFPDVAAELIYELGLDNAVGEVTLVLHSNGTVSIKQEH